MVHRKGNVSVFNLFFGGSKGGRVALFPSVASNKEKKDFWIGNDTVISIDTMQGGASPYGHLESTLVHEVGHWFGLFVRVHRI